MSDFFDVAYGVANGYPFITIDGNNVLQMLQDYPDTFDYVKDLIGAYLLISLFIDIVNVLPHILDGTAYLFGHGDRYDY